MTKEEKLINFIKLNFCVESLCVHSDCGAIYTSQCSDCILCDMNEDEFCQILDNITEKLND